MFTEHASGQPKSAEAVTEELQAIARGEEVRGDEARATLAAVYGTYTEGFTTPDLVDAKILPESFTS